MDSLSSPSLAKMRPVRAKSTPSNDLESAGSKRTKRQQNDDREYNDIPKPRSPKRRKAKDAIPNRMKQVEQLATDADVALGLTPASSKNVSKTSKPSKVEEKRQRPWRKKPSQRYLEKLDRALTQRMFVVGRKRGGTNQDPEETFTMVGTVGNVYEITIGKLPSCTCPDSLNGNHCKHLVYIMNKVLHAREDLQYQVAFVSSELREIFENAPPSPTEAAKTDDESGRRKAIDGDCPICFTSFEPKENEIVWCRAACGNNIHKTCFEQWTASTRSRGVTCVYCRAPWQSGSTDEMLKSGRVNREGYVNVAAQYGLSGERDYSRYHQFWVERQMARRGSEWDA